MVSSRLNLHAILSNYRIDNDELVSGCGETDKDC